MDRRERLQQREEELKELYPRLLRRVNMGLGRIFSAVYGIPRLGPLVMSAFARLASFLLVELNIMGLKRLRGGGAEEIAYGWMKLTAALCSYCRVEEAEEGRVVLSWEGCPLGYESPSQKGLCRSVMSIDQMTARRLGGRMEIAQTVPEGHARCRFVFTTGDN